MSRFGTLVAAFFAAGTLFLALWVALWLAVPSSLFLKPRGVTYQWDEDEGKYFTYFVRETPHGKVRANYDVEAQVFATGLECPDSGDAEYQPVPDPDDEFPNRVRDTVMWPTPMALVPCITAERPVIVVYKWSVTEVWGIPLLLPLRPVELSVWLEKRR